MPEAMRLIVSGYMRLKDRKSLEALREHRQRLRKGLTERPSLWLDISGSIRQLDDDISVIEEGLSKLDDGNRRGL